MLKPSWWTLFQLGLLLRREDIEDPTISRGVRLLDIIAHSLDMSKLTVKATAAIVEGDEYDLELLEDILSITDS